MKIRICKLIMLSVMLITISCGKEVGKGGSSSIKGKIWVKKYNGLGVLLKEYYAPDKDVFINYGINDSIFDDKTETGFNGVYSFRYLSKGKYTMYAYSDCWKCPSGDSAVFVDIEVTENGTLFDAPTITVINN